MKKLLIICVLTIVNFSDQNRVINKFENSQIDLSSDDKQVECNLKPKLTGPLNIDLNEILALSYLEKVFTWVHNGGVYETECTKWPSVAVIIPYRNRYLNLVKLLSHLHPLLRKQQIHYKIYVIEQVGNDPFNKGKVLNVGVTEASKEKKYDCFILHDVTMLATDDRNLYRCNKYSPKHLSVIIDSHQVNRLCYAEFIGGVIAIRTTHFLSVNGFSNLFWGWGGEDDDFYKRLMYRKLQVVRPPEDIAKFVTTPHQLQEENPHRFVQLQHPKNQDPSSKSGLSNLSYGVVEKVIQKLFTLILVDLQAPVLFLKKLRSNITHSTRGEPCKPLREKNIYKKNESY